MWDLVSPDPSAVASISGFVPRFSVLVEDLGEWSNEAIKQRVMAAFPRLALWALRDARDPRRLVENLAHWGAAFVEASQTPSGIQAVARLVRYVWLVADDLHYALFRAKIQEFAPEAESAIMTIAEELRQEGSTQAKREILVE